MYKAAPVNFGGNVGPHNFDGESDNNNITETISTVPGTMCLFYQLATGGIPSEINTVTQLPVKISTWAANLLAPQFANFGCPNIAP